ncbi:MAG: hypothetical protein Q9164_000812 [Protoblastenia rupestris]
MNEKTKGKMAPSDKYKCDHDAPPGSGVLDYVCKECCRSAREKESRALLTKHMNEVNLLNVWIETFEMGPQTECVKFAWFRYVEEIIQKTQIMHMQRDKIGKEWDERWEGKGDAGEKKGGSDEAGGVQMVSRPKVSREGSK